MQFVYVPWNTHRSHCPLHETLGFLDFETYISYLQIVKTCIEFNHQSNKYNGIQIDQVHYLSLSQPAIETLSYPLKLSTKSHLHEKP